MLLYCLCTFCSAGTADGVDGNANSFWSALSLLAIVDVVQSIRPSSEGLSGRGVAVVGVTSRLVRLTLCTASV